MESMQHLFWMMPGAKKGPVSAELIRKTGRAIVFCRTRAGVDRVGDELEYDGVSVETLHGGLSQHNRDRAMERFQHGETMALVATDVAARGIDVAGVNCVIHYDPPENGKAYKHRSGRTARAGTSGIVISFVPKSKQRGYTRIQSNVGIKCRFTLPQIETLKENEFELVAPKENHMDVKVLILGIIAVEDITVVITMEITTEAETVVVEEIPDAAAVGYRGGRRKRFRTRRRRWLQRRRRRKSRLDAAAAVATVAVETVEEIQVVAAVAVATVAVETAEEIQVVAAGRGYGGGGVATEAAAEEEQADAAAAVATVAVETVEEILDVAAVAEEILDVAAVETAAEIPTMEDTVVVTEMCTKAVTVEEILAVAETEVETKITAPIPIKVIERLNRIIETPAPAKQDNSSSNKDSRSSGYRGEAKRSNLHSNTF